MYAGDCRGMHRAVPKPEKAAYDDREAEYFKKLIL
jgi:hypothetical protein